MSARRARPAPLGVLYRGDAQSHVGLGPVLAGKEIMHAVALLAKEDVSQILDDPPRALFLGDLVAVGANRSVFVLRRDAKAYRFAYRPRGRRRGRLVGVLQGPRCGPTRRGPPTSASYDLA